jgi:hypothetical protein
VGRQEKKRAAAIAQALTGKHVLTVSDLPELDRRSTVINFYIDQRKIRFEVSLQAAARAGVVIRSELLNLARIADD